MTFPLVPKRLPAKLCLLLLVSAPFTHAAVSATTHPRSTALPSALLYLRGGGGGMIVAIIVAIIGVVGTIIAAKIMKGPKQ
jgi:hypothetical protein